ncbi:MAG: hypothetical protein OXR66_05420 [Candidatus Woesearchaeota archaeon]|nr:hypothetical protein [Candidatus Woesearchaeota archaeon]
MADILPRVQEMKQRGVGNNQIIETLKHEGHASSEIFDALGQVQTPAPPPVELPPQQLPPQAFGADNEELIEAIIDEKWNDLMSDINKVIAWKDTTESRITRLEQELTDTKEQFDKLHKAIIGKVGEYDEHILSVGAEVKAMEKVFSKVLPVFTENVAELQRITDKVKKR